MTGSVGKDGVPCWMAGAVRTLQKEMCALKVSVVERTERERHSGVILEQLKNAQKDMCELRGFSRDVQLKNAHAGDLEREVDFGW